MNDWGRSLPQSFPPMFINSHIASGFVVGALAKQRKNWTLLLIFATIIPDIDGIWSNTVAGHHSILHTPIYWILLCGLGWIVGKAQQKTLIQKGAVILFCGAMLHLFTDWVTARTVGIQWLFPFNDTDFYVYPIQPEHGNLPIWEMVIPPYINFYFENKILVWGEIGLNLIAIVLLKISLSNR